MRILGIDYGKKRIGVSISSKVAQMALPLATIEHEGSLPKAMMLLKKKFLELKDIKEIALGWPLLMSGEQSPMCKEVLQFKSLLEATFKIPVYLVDERLTTKIAEDSFKSIGISRKDRTAHIDQAAAVNILNTFLDKKKHL